MFDGSKYGDMAADPELWEKKWNADLKSRWQGPRSRWGSPLANIGDRTSPGEAKIHISDANLLNMHAVISQVCHCQNDFAMAVAHRALSSDYEHDWLALSDSRRREIVLEGICRAMRTETLIPGRCYCPDSTLENLASAHGEHISSFFDKYFPKILAMRLRSQELSLILLSIDISR